MEHYYSVLPADISYQADSLLTYAYKSTVTPYSVVQIAIKNKTVPGIVFAEVNKPHFALKPIQQVTNFVLQPQQITLLQWIHEYYPSSKAKIASLFAHNFMLRTEQPTITTPTIKKPINPPPLTSQQSLAVKAIADSPDSMILLHGDTGSGKTRVYIELIKQVLKQKHSALVLVPEIGLSPQLFQQLTTHFDCPIILLHSKMTPKQKNEAYATLRSHASCIVVGPRSALFSPYQNLGLIVVDEFHDSSYKQEQAPYYLTSRIVAKLAAIWDCKVILGSATPDVSDYYVFSGKNLPIVRLKGLAKKHNFTNTVQIVDSKDRAQFPKSAYLSAVAQKAISTNLAKKEQSLIFHNRRGSARVILCNQCGWQAQCPDCDLNLTYHKDDHNMRCHSCGHTTKPILTCPDCRNQDVIYKSPGTKALERELQSIFPQASIARFDADNKKQDSLAEQYQHLLSGAFDIIIGTQMITKGLDLPLLKTVIVTSAEHDMTFPDFSARQSSYQQLQQIIGRANRGHRSGEIIIQTHNPKSDLIRHAINNDFQAFYEQEIAERQTYNFPPFTYMLVVQITRKTQKGVSKAANDLAKKLTKTFPDIDISQAYPCFKEKNNQGYRWQIVARSKERTHLTGAIKELPANATYDIDPISLL